MPHLNTLLLEIAVILLACRAVGRLFRLIGQPQVVGEMAAGILLGPSCLGLLAPDLAARLFPREGLPALQSLSQIGLLIFMFLVGAELNPAALRRCGKTAIATSSVSIVVPFSLGALLASFLYDPLSAHRVPFWDFALFMGAAMSVTAFPVLARILGERDLLHTPVGAVAIACAAVDDATAWCILAGVVVLVKSAGAADLAITVLGLFIYLIIMVCLIRPLLRLLDLRRGDETNIGHDSLGVALLLLLGSAWTTEWLGIHALFGAFLAGAILPRRATYIAALREKFEDAVVVLLVPLFFALTGLRTSFALVNGAHNWMYAALILAVAVMGKFGGSSLAARATGMSWRDAGIIGVLMNTRGLMELVILNVGFEIGVITPTVYSMMVLMALITTFMTTPLLDWLYPAAARARDRELVMAGAHHA